MPRSCKKCLIRRAFLVPAADGGQLVRQSLWFDKTTIRSDGEPERLPYTMHELPLDPPEEE